MELPHKRDAAEGLGTAWATAGETGAWHLVNLGIAWDTGNLLESTFSRGGLGSRDIYKGGLCRLVMWESG